MRPGSRRRGLCAMNDLLARPMKTRLLLAILLGLFWFPAGILPGQAQVDSLPTVALHIGKATLHAEVAATGPERERGLMNRPKLGDNDGMIFLMPHIEMAFFWMKNTLIPLSIAFIDKNGVILEIHDMMPADPAMEDKDVPRTHSTSNRVAYALETNLHWFSLNGLKPGDRIDPP